MATVTGPMRACAAANLKIVVRFRKNTQFGTTEKWKHQNRTIIKKVMAQYVTSPRFIKIDAEVVSSSWRYALPDSHKQSNNHFYAKFYIPHELPLCLLNSEDKSWHLQKSAHWDGQISWDSMTHPCQFTLRKQNSWKYFMPNVSYFTPFTWGEFSKCLQ